MPKLDLPEEVIQKANKSKPESWNETLALVDALKLGEKIEFLRQAGINRYKIGNGEGEAILGTLNWVHKRLLYSDLDTPVISQVRAFEEELEQKYDDSEETISDEDGDELKEKASTWQHLLKENLKSQKRIPISNPGVLDVKQLIDSPNELFTSEVWSWLDERPKSDLKEACRTIAVGCSTSCVMLSLRAVEHCLREWYEFEDEPLNAGWGHVLGQLIDTQIESEDRNDSIISQLSELPAVLSNLYYLKEKRNEVNHPDESPSPQEARRTLMIVASTITDIHEEMREKVQTDSLSVSITPQDHFESEVDFFSQLIIQIEKKNPSDFVPHEEVVEIGRELGFKNSTIEENIEKLKMRGEIYEPEKGGYRHTLS